MKKMLLVFGSGGHSAQGLLLYNQLKDKFNIEVMLEKCDPLSEKKIKGAKIYKATKLRGAHGDIITTPIRIVVLSFQSLFILFKSKPDIVLSTGPGIAIAVSLLAKIFGKKVVFVESWSRVTTKSLAGRTIYPFADKFFIQWPEMKAEYPRGEYQGRLG